MVTKVKGNDEEGVGELWSKEREEIATKSTRKTGAAEGNYDRELSEETLDETGRKFWRRAVINDEGRNSGKRQKRKERENDKENVREIWLNEREEIATKSTRKMHAGGENCDRELSEETLDEKGRKF